MRWVFKSQWNKTSSPKKKKKKVWPHAVHETSTLRQTLLKYKINWYTANNVLAQNKKQRASSQVTDMFMHTSFFTPKQSEHWSEVVQLAVDISWTNAQMNSLAMKLTVSSLHWSHLTSSCRKHGLYSQQHSGVIWAHIESVEHSDLMSSCRKRGVYG